MDTELGPAAVEEEDAAADVDMEKDVAPDVAVGLASCRRLTSCHSPSVALGAALSEG